MNFADRVKEITTVVGTGPATLAGAALGFASFASKFADYDEIEYVIELGAEWEVGRGHRLGTTLVRTTVTASSNAGALVNFSAGAKNVFCTVSALTQTASFGNGEHLRNLIADRFFCGGGPEQTTDATPLPLVARFYGWQTGSEENSLRLSPQQAYAASLVVVAYEDATNAAASWKVDMCAKRISLMSVPTIVGTPSIVSIGADPGAVAWTLVAQSGPTETIQLVATGEAAKTISWSVSGMAAIS